jgi:hypothetical protein
MITLHPNPDVKYDCPYCCELLRITGWYMPGMRTMAKMNCAICGKYFYGDMESGHGTIYPSVMDISTGEIFHEGNESWYGSVLRKSYLNRVYRRIENQIIGRGIRDGFVILNCLDYIFGHSLLKLLNAQRHMRVSDTVDLLVIIPKKLKWLVPHSVKYVWEWDIEYSNGAEWNDWIADAIYDFVGRYKITYLSKAHSHPNKSTYEIEQFAKCNKYDYVDHLNKPIKVITFVWRDDRCWSKYNHYSTISRLLNFHSNDRRKILRQKNNIEELFAKMRKSYPEIVCNVVGITSDGTHIEFANDLRHFEITKEIEREWCNIYGQSDVVVGVHGSNMLIPSALAGTCIDLMPQERWGNLTQDILYGIDDVREAAIRYLYLPVNIEPTELANVICRTLAYKYKAHKAFVVSSG